jgi:hypothetical protein
MSSVPIRKPSAKVASVGVTRTQLYVEEQLEWLFREQPTEDYGIDAHVEIVDGENVRGRLLALQIKSGASWFHEPADGGWWYRPDEDHVTYWLHHSLPVVVVLYDPIDKACHWQLVNATTLEQSKNGGWKLFVPEANLLDAQAAEAWRSAAAGDPYELRVRELRLAKPWMEMLADGTRLVVDFEEWINKSSGRGSISIGIDHEDGNDPEELVTWHLWVGPASYAESVPRFFAWADVDLHEQTYYEADHDRYEEECTIWDEGERYFTTTFDDWRRALVATGIRPYDNAAGEVDYYRLRLSLSELGKAFLIVDEFATSGLGQLTL